MNMHEQIGHPVNGSIEEGTTIITIERYHRWQGIFEKSGNVDAVCFTGPDGGECRRPVFRHQPTHFTYDAHGYETISPAGGELNAVRFTPDQLGKWRYVWLYGERVVQEGSFTCTPGNHPGYIEVSPRDSRYFAFTNGSSYAAIGLNLCWPQMFALSTGSEFITGEGRGTIGAREFERWFQALAGNGGNFARLWLGMHYLQPEGEVAGELDLLRFAAIDRVVALARHYGIRLKLCLEYFRTFEKGTGQSRVLRHPSDGRSPKDMDEWFQSPDWQGLWRYKLSALLARYGDDPVVMAWELWNEINCCATSRFQIQNDWTREVLREIKSASPRNLVVNSLGSYDYPAFQAIQDAFKMDEMDFQQVHRYLDQGAGLDICRTDPVALSIDAIQRSRRPDRPVLLAETGAVNDCHSGPFRYFSADHDGLIFHDTTYAAFFAGAAGTGHIWHWDRYVDQKNLWYGFCALADALRGVALDREGFEPMDLSTNEYWCLVLRGRTVVLVWLRNKADRWDRVLRDTQPPLPVTTAHLNLVQLGVAVTTAEIFRPWPGDAVGKATIVGSTLILPPFTHGVVCRLAARLLTEEAVP